MILVLLGALGGERVGSFGTRRRQVLRERRINLGLLGQVVGAPREEGGEDEQDRETRLRNAPVVNAKLKALNIAVCSIPGSRQIGQESDQPQLVPVALGYMSARGGKQSFELA